MAAEVEHISMTYSVDYPVPHFHYSGPVDPGDFDKFAARYFEVVTCSPERLGQDGDNCAVVTMDSPGGNYVEGLMMAEFFRANAIATLVQTGSECHSACAMAFMGGSGRSGDRNVGAYVDRTVEPGGLVGFHAPYFQNELVEQLIVEYGTETVLGSSRDLIADMVENIVQWNVDQQVIAQMIAMGPNEIYGLETPEDLFLARTDLSAAPLIYWNNDPASALRFACANLLASYEGTTPSAVLDRLGNAVFEMDMATGPQGELLTGYRYAQPDAFNAHICAVPTAQSKLNADADIALYAGPGIEGAMRPMHSFFHRPEGWSSMGTGGASAQRILKKGQMTRVFLDPRVAVPAANPLLEAYLLGRNFIGLDAQGTHYLPDAPEIAYPLESLYATGFMEALETGNIRVYVQTGNAQLFPAVRDAIDNPNHELTHSSVSASSFAYSGNYAQTNRHFAWVGFTDGEESGFVRLDVMRPDGAEPDFDDLTMLRDIQCAISFKGLMLNCQ